jgi:chromosomal replication initiation ATPase DnaA
MSGLDPRYTFDNFIVGATNRLAAAAARRVAESPGTSYNPLYVYSASGLGKTHLLTAIGNHALRIQPGISVVFDTLERAIGRIPLGGSGEGDLSAVQLLLLDDVQYLGGDRKAQETLLAWWDELASRGVQIVLAADRPPSEIDALDHRLLSRFAAGLVADLAPPDYETRVALVRRKTEERGHTLGEGVAEAIARVAYGNVRELQGGLNRVLAAQELDGVAVKADGVAALLGYAPEKRETVEFDAFYSEVAGAVAELATSSGREQRLVDAIMRFEAEGIRTFRLEVALRSPPSEAEVIDLIDRFGTDVERLKTIAAEIRVLDPEAPELARADLLRNPDRVLEAEALVAQVHERLRPLPEPGPGPGFDGIDLPSTSPALAAARAAARRPGARAGPLYIRGARRSGKSALLTAVAQQLRAEMPMLPVALVRGPDFAAELLEAVGHGRADSWRARFRRARVLIVDDFDRIAAPEIVRDELYRLFDGIRRSGGQIILSGEREPTLLDGAGDRLAAIVSEADVAEMSAATAKEAKPQPAGRNPHPEVKDVWFLHREKALPRWPAIEDWLVTELD